jgi:serine/threonine-protein kinase HipA
MIPLDELRHVESAVVLKQGTRAGRLERHPDAVVFTYDEHYRQSGGPPVATTLPLHEKQVVTHAPGALPPFFSGLLPEGRRLVALRGAVKTSADDEFSLLIAVGGDAVGDVRIVPEGEASTDTDAMVVVSDWNEVRFADLLAASVGGSGEVDRVAIPGVQDKVSARMINLPVARANSRFMLKLDPPEFPHLVTNEAFFLEAGRLSGLETAEAEVVRDVEGSPGLLVRRFDRAAASGAGVARLSQEDACQVLARYPADKYRVTTEDVVEALAEVCQARLVAAHTLVKQFAFAYITCNGDAHAKNFSVMREAGEWRPTPAYDVPTSYVYGDHTMALTLNGKRREDIGRADFIALGDAVGVRARAVESALDKLCEGVSHWIGELAGLPFDPGMLVKLRRAIEYRQGRLAR